MIFLKNAISKRQLQINARLPRCARFADLHQSGLVEVAFRKVAGDRAAGRSRCRREFALTTAELSICRTARRPMKTWRGHRAEGVKSVCLA